MTENRGDLFDFYASDPFLANGTFVYEPRPGSRFLGRYADAGSILKRGGLAVLEAVMSDDGSVRLSDLPEDQFESFARSVLEATLLYPKLAPAGEPTVRGVQYSYEDLAWAVPGYLARCLAGQRDAAPFESSSAGKPGSISPSTSTSSPAATASGRAS